MFKLVEKHDMDASGMKAAFANTVCDLAREDARVIYMDADLCRPAGMKDTYKAEFPDRYIGCGIMEGNMAGVANGLSAAGMIPFAQTFACFASRKCADQFFLTGCFAQQNVKLVGSDPGLTAELNGASHAGLEDMGVYMGFPNVTLLDPCDPVEFAALLRLAKETHGMFYIRYNRKPTPRIYEPGSEFELGKAHVIRPGKDVSLIGSGIMVHECIKAADLLAAEGISARVVDMHTWKPVDRECILACAKETGAIVTAENHNASSGLGRAVASVVVEECPVPMGIIGVKDRFSQVGKLAYLLKEYGMTAEDIAAKAKATIVRK